jgi:phosphoesterase RecJ-like protein
MLNTNEQFLNRLKKSQAPLLVFPADWPGEAVAVSVTLFQLLEKLGKQPTLAAAPSWRQKTWDFLPTLKKIKHQLEPSPPLVISVSVKEAEVARIKYNYDGEQLKFFIFPKEKPLDAKSVKAENGLPAHDLIIVVGAVDLDALGSIYTDNIELFYKTDIINLDCQSENEEFGQINLVDLSAATISEILYFALSENERRLISNEIATSLLAGLIAGTKSFKNNRLTPKTLELASLLMAAGGEREKIVNHLYRSRNFSTLKLWGKVLAGLKSELDSALIWSYIRQEDFKNAGAGADNLIDIIDELIANIPEARAITLIFEDPEKDGQLKTVLYASKNMDALKLLKNYQPQGNFRLAQASLPKAETMPAATEKYLSNLKQQLSVWLAH